MSNLTPFIVAVLTLLVLASPLSSLVDAAKYRSDFSEDFAREEMIQSFRNSTQQRDLPTEQAGQIKTETIIDYVEPAPEDFSAFADNCGDGTNQFSTDGVHWEGFPVTYAVDPANSGVDPTTTVNAVVASFNEFDKYMPDNSFTLISNYAAAEIKVRWAFLDGPFGQVGVASFSYSLPDKELISATITLDSGDSWFVSSVERCTASGSLIDIESVASHELGHAVGLDHVSDQLQTMYPTTFAGATLQRSLGNGDRAGLTNLYFDWSAFQSLGGNIKSNPAVAVNSDGRLQVFAVAADNQLYFKSQSTAGSNTWSAWMSLGGNLKGDPAVARNLDGRLEVFVVAATNTLYHKWQSSVGSNTWSAWMSLGGNIKSNPAVAVNSDGRLQVFVVAVDNGLYDRWQLTPPFL
jgi:predicted Zn-dependent protease